jgi:hypothetical protein
MGKNCDGFFPILRKYEGSFLHVKILLLWLSTTWFICGSGSLILVS